MEKLQQLSNDISQLQNELYLFCEGLDNAYDICQCLMHWISNNNSNNDEI